MNTYFYRISSGSSDYPLVLSFPTDLSCFNFVSAHIGKDPDLEVSRIAICNPDTGAVEPIEPYVITHDCLIYFERCESFNKDFVRHVFDFLGCALSDYEAKTYCSDRSFEDFYQRLIGGEFNESKES